MTSLLDIAPIETSVPIERGGKTYALNITGVSALGISVLLRDFPDLRKVITGLGDQVNAESLVAQAPEIIANIIAAGTGHPGEADHIAAAHMLAAGDQFAVIEKIIEVTFPRGLGPFAERLSALTGGLDLHSVADAVSGKAADTKSRAPSRKLPQAATA